MEIQEKSKEQIIELLVQYNENEKNEIEKKKRFTLIAMVIILTAFIYMRFFNTVYDIDWRTGEIKVLYSTAWVVRYPAKVNKNPKEDEVEQVSTIMNLGRYFSVFCPNAKFVYIEDGIEAIGVPYSSDLYQGFYDSGLWAVRLPDTLSYVGYKAFSCCYSLKKVYWKEAPESTIIAERAFSRTGLKRIELPEGITVVGGLAFSDNEKLESVKLPDTIMRMDAGVFAQCLKLNQVNLPESLEILQDCAFFECENLKNVAFPEGLMGIGRYAFVGTSITKEQFPEDLYFYSYMSDSEEESVFDEYIISIRDVLSYTLRGTIDVYNMDLENKYLSEKTGIPLEVFSEDKDSERIWIEGQYYTLPMSLEEFLAKDDWNYMGAVDGYVDNPCKGVYEHTKSGRILYLSVEEGSSPVVRGITVYKDREKPCCYVVLPGGITNQGMHYYRISELYGWDRNASDDRWSYSLDSSEQPMSVEIIFDEWSSEIDTIKIER